MSGCAGPGRVQWCLQIWGEGAQLSKGSMVGRGKPRCQGLGFSFPNDGDGGQERSVPGCEVQRRGSQGCWVQSRDPGGSPPGTAAWGRVYTRLLEPLE